MGICWYCHWGWPKQVAEVYDSALIAVAGDEASLKYGPAHIVWEDENFRDSNLQFCLKCCDDPAYLEGFSQSQIDVVRWSLNELLKIPEWIRCCQPAEYDGEHPEQFPPPGHIRMETRR